MRAYMAALDAQVDLIRFWRGHWGQPLASSWVKALMKVGPDETVDEVANQLAAKEADLLDRSDTYWVSPTMVEVIDSQRNKIPSYELRPEDIPSPRGFAFLGQPMWVTDKSGDRCNVQALSWSVETIIDPADDDSRERGILMRVYSDRDNREDVWSGWEDVLPDYPCRWVMFHTESWVFNQMLPSPEDPKFEGSDPALRILASFWTMVNQKIVVTPEMEVERHVRRRAQRAGVGEVPDVKVVVLRREYEKGTWEAGESDGKGRGYSHAFWVRGHLRNQWYRSEGRHKPIWIEPFVKGEGPPQPKDVVFTLTR